ncbi:penicillin-binding protein 2 [bacterium]|nr:penicillin-binding protein 2 [bacterium]
MRGSGFDPVSVEVFNNRLKKVTFVVIGVFAALVLRLWFLQIVNGPGYRIQSENNRIHLQDIPPFRGMIFDRNGELLVDNRPSFDLYIIPEEIQNRTQLLTSIEKLIDLDPVWVKSKLSGLSRKRPFKPVLIKKSMPRDELAVIETNLFNLAGVMIQVRPQRHYIFGRFASHVVGYLGEISENQLNSGRYPNSKPGDHIGKYGVEGKWQKQLNGFRGGEQVEVDAAGRKLRVISRKPPVPGFNISLNIEKDLQFKAEALLKEKKGAIVAMDPNNGEILALANGPAFDPNLFIVGIDRSEWQKIINSKDYPLQDRAIAGQYPPGSVFKIVVALAGLEEGIIDPEEELFCNGGYKFGNRTYHCWRKQGHGKVDLHKALVQSCDVYFYKIGRRIGIDNIAHYGKMFGLGQKPGFDLGREKAGLMPTREWKLKRRGVPWQPGETLSLSIGQSFLLVTPIQMASLISAVFNGGTLYQPKVIQRVGKDGQVVYKVEPASTGQIKAKKENLELIKRALWGVVNEPHGTGSRARIRGREIAGKTGTAQVVKLGVEKKLGIGKDLPREYNDHAWFVALADTERPRLALAILVEHGGHGGSAAAPIAKEMFKTFFEKK